MATASAPQAEFTKFELDGLKAHNEFRRKHGVPDLKLKKELCKYAQEWADVCAKKGSIDHRPNPQYGENIYYHWSSDKSLPSAWNAVKSWYDEIKKYKFGKEAVIKGTGHFTQVVWKGSTHLGIAMAVNEKGAAYVVANYEPRGNWVGKFVENVPKVK